MNLDDYKQLTFEQRFWFDLHVKLVQAIDELRVEIRDLAGAMKSL